MKSVVPLLLPIALLSGLSAAEPTTAKHGMVVCVSAPAADVGLDILKRGGNAVDAAVAVAFAEAVTYPIAGNIGGGGFMLIHPAPGKGGPVVIDYRETAPAAATVDMFAKGRDAYSLKAVAVPGTVLGLADAAKGFGSQKLSWRELIEPSIKLAADGFEVEQWTSNSLNEELAKFKQHAEFQRAFAKSTGGPWKAGDRLVQPDLAKTLRLIADQGPNSFYLGPISELIVAEMNRGGGLIKGQDLADYRTKERRPFVGTYRGHGIVSVPLPSAGGPVLVEMLNMLECFDPNKLDSATYSHVMAEVMRRAYVHRYIALGDGFDISSFHSKFRNKQYAREQSARIDLTKATPSTSLAADTPLKLNTGNTTHFSIVDSSGMAVSNTYTLEDRYGSHIVVPGAGFLLNNEMNDFNPVPGVTKADGQIGTAPNLIAPGKRMLSSMTPTIVKKDGKIMLVTGSPGGRTITNTVLNIIVNTIDHGMDIQAAVDAPRMHHAAFPDEIKMEKVAERKELVAALQKMGHKVVEHVQGDAHSIAIDPKTGELRAGVDHRIMGKAAGY
ncbi:MAG: gamma-glutamyltransferase [Gemmataceae bacterium]